MWSTEDGSDRRAALGKQIFTSGYRSVAAVPEEKSKPHNSDVEETTMYRKLSLLAAASICLFATGALAQSGSVSKAVGGYSFEDAAKEAAGTKNFNSKDGQLTFAIVTHTAGNGFFDPVYVGARVAAN